MTAREDMVSAMSSLFLFAPLSPRPSRFCHAALFSCQCRKHRYHKIGGRQAAEKDDYETATAVFCDTAAVFPPPAGVGLRGFFPFGLFSALFSPGGAGMVLACAARRLSSFLSAFSFDALFFRQTAAFSAFVFCPFDSRPLALSRRPAARKAKSAACPL